MAEIACLSDGRVGMAELVVVEFVWPRWFVDELVLPRWSTSVTDLVCVRDGCDPFNLISISKVQVFL